MSDFSIRPVKPQDVPELLTMIRELAEFEKLTHLVTATEEDYQNALFGTPPSAGAAVAQSDDGLLGYAVYFENFSTFAGIKGLYLEDLYVRPEHRQKGIGKELIRHVGRIAKDRDCIRFEWCVLDWNQNAIDFYKRLGADVMDEWRIVRLNHPGIEKLSGES